MTMSYRSRIFAPHGRRLISDIQIQEQIATLAEAKHRGTAFVFFFFNELDSRTQQACNQCFTSFNTAKLLLGSLLSHAAQ